MQHSKILTVLLGAGLLWLVGRSVPAHADVWNKKTNVTFGEPVELPGGVVLQPGEYVMKLSDSTLNRNVVQVLSANEDQVYATILAVPNYRMQPTDKTAISVYETQAGQPALIKAWFYPGDNYGQEFAYPKERAAYLARATGINVPIAPAEDQAEAASAVTPKEQEPDLDAGLPSEPQPTVTETALMETPPPEPQPATQDMPPAVSQSQAAAPQTADPQTAPTAEEKELPKTASNMPVLGMMGLLSLVAAFASKLLILERTDR